MKNIILLEGIASSGKSTVEKFLAEKLFGAQLILEDDTLMPLIENKDVQVAHEHLLKLVERIHNSQSQNIIIDRFQFTHAFRTDSDITQFSGIEDALASVGNALLVLLTINPEHIKERIEETIELRKDNWKKGAQGSLDEKITYYTKQQEILKSFSLTSKIRILQIDTTEKKWGEYAELIMKHLT